MLDDIGRTLGLGFAAGINLYATVAILGLASRYDWVDLPSQYHAFDNNWIIGAAIVLYVVEFVADKVPWVDSAWDFVHTIIRPAGGALIAVASMGHAGPGVQAAAALVGAALSVEQPSRQGRDTRGREREPGAAVELGAEPVRRRIRGGAGVSRDGVSEDCRGGRHHRAHHDHRERGLAASHSSAALAAYMMKPVIQNAEFRMQNAECRNRFRVQGREVSVCSSSNQLVTTVIADADVVSRQADHQKAIILRVYGIADAGVRPQVVYAVEEHDWRSRLERGPVINRHRHQAGVVAVEELATISRPVRLISAGGRDLPAPACPGQIAHVDFLPSGLVRDVRQPPSIVRPVARNTRRTVWPREAPAWHSLRSAILINSPRLLPPVDWA